MEIRPIEHLTENLEAYHMRFKGERKPGETYKVSRVEQFLPDFGIKTTGYKAFLEGIEPRRKYKGTEGISHMMVEHLNLATTGFSDPAEEDGLEFYLKTPEVVDTENPRFNIVMSDYRNSTKSVVLEISFVGDNQINMISDLKDRRFLEFAKKIAEVGFPYPDRRLKSD